MNTGQCKMLFLVALVIWITGLIAVLFNQSSHSSASESHAQSIVQQLTSSLQTLSAENEQLQSRIERFDAQKVQLLTELRKLRDELDKAMKKNKVLNQAAAANNHNSNNLIQVLSRTPATPFNHDDAQRRQLLLRQQQQQHHLQQQQQQQQQQHTTVPRKRIGSPAPTPSLADLMKPFAAQRDPNEKRNVDSNDASKQQQQKQQQQQQQQQGHGAPPLVEAGEILVGPDGVERDTTCGLTRPQCHYTTRRFLTYTQGGGFNNQRQSLERAFQLALLLNRTLIVRDIWVDQKHNPGVSNPELFLDFEVFFDLPKMRRAIPVIPQKDFEAMFPGLMASRKHMRGIFKQNTHWTDSIPCNYSANPIRDITNKRDLPAAQLFGILERLGCEENPVLEVAAIGMNRFWRTSSKLRALAAKYVDLSPLIHQQAQHLRHLFMESCGANDDDSFICVHYRQGDKLHVSPREYNYTAQLVVDILKEKQFVREGEPMYIASDVLPEQLERLDPFRKAFNAKTSYDFGAYLDSLNIPVNDYLGAIEVVLCSASRLFFASSSTLSASIMNTRHGITGLTEWEIDESTNFKVTRLTREWKQQHQL